MITVDLISVEHPWSMPVLDQLKAFEIVQRKFRRSLGVDVALGRFQTIIEPPIDVNFQFESQVAGYMLRKCSEILPPAPGHFGLYLIRPVVKIATNGKEIRKFYGAAEKVCKVPGKASCSCAIDILRKAPTPYYVAAMMMAHELAHLCGAQHDPTDPKDPETNQNIMSRLVGQYSGYPRSIKFNEKARKEVKACLQAAQILF